jgi:hypothetical protein
MKLRDCEESQRWIRLVGNGPQGWQRRTSSTPISYHSGTIRWHSNLTLLLRRRKGRLKGNIVRVKSKEEWTNCSQRPIASGTFSIRIYKGFTICIRVSWRLYLRGSECYGLGIGIWKLMVQCSTAGMSRHKGLRLGEGVGWLLSVTLMVGNN